MRSGRPEGRFRRQQTAHVMPVVFVDRLQALTDGGQPALMGKQHPQADLILAGGGKFRPYPGNGIVQVDLAAVDGIEGKDGGETLAR